MLIHHNWLQKYDRHNHSIVNYLHPSSIGNPGPDISWYKNNQAIFESRRIKFLYGDDGLCSLVIKDITTEDRGKYKCVASNKKGKIQCSAELFVEGMFMYVICYFGYGFKLPIYQQDQKYVRVLPTDHHFNFQFTVLMGRSRNLIRNL